MGPTGNSSSQTLWGRPKNFSLLLLLLLFFLLFFPNLPRIYSKLEILLFWLTRFLLHKLFLSKMRFNKVNFSPRCARNNNFSQTTFSVWVSFSPTPEHRGTSYWKFVFPDPLGTAEKFGVIVFFWLFFSNLPR